MAMKLCFFLCLSLSLAASSIAARPLHAKAMNISLQAVDYHMAGNYTRVCDPRRFANQGLRMKDFAFCDHTLPYAVRAKDLVDRMTLDEKAKQIGDTALGVERLLIPRYEWWSEALHGVADVGQQGSTATYFGGEVPGATSFPMVILTAASFNSKLWRTVAETISTEARAMRNLGHAGLTFWSPNVNVIRDPRWGRTLETPGEDPYVVGEYAVQFVRGLQDVEGTENFKDLDSRPLKVAACCKHYAAYDVENWKGVDRYHFDARVTEQDMRETFLRPFETCVKEGDVSSVMCSYNKVNGIPACADPNLLRHTVRDKWNLHGYIVSDCDSVDVMLSSQHWLNDEPEDAVAQAMKSGLDLDCGFSYPNFGSSAVMKGKISESHIDDALNNLYKVLMRLGFFDGMPKYEKLGKANICSSEHVELAIEAARQGTVLLKNDKNTLPLNPQTIKNIALVGPHANATRVMIGNYQGVPCGYVSPLAAFSAEHNVTYATGCADVPCAKDDTIYQAVQAAAEADATVLVFGLDLSVESEGRDRTDLLLPGYQTQLINDVAAHSKGPLILVLFSGGAVDIGFAASNPNVTSILWMGYPGEKGGNAMVDVIFGKHNPGGRLPITFYTNNYVNQLPLTSMLMRPDATNGYPGRTYKFFNGPVVYPFGFGMSYTTFNVSLISSTKSLDIKLHRLTHCRDVDYTDGAFKPDCPALATEDLECTKHTINIELEVTNTGNMDGRETMLVYWVPPKDIKGAPQKQLVAFESVFVKKGASQKLNMKLDACKSLGLVDNRGYHILPSGSGTLIFGHEEQLTVPITVTYRK